MSSESTDKQVQQQPARPSEAENLPCPRCQSTNTKFCYYNNYNLSQPRHFCKSCRRYWTRGGTLRNLPVGGGTRKSNKRSRTTTTTTSPAPSTSSSSTVTTTDLLPAKPVTQSPPFFVAVNLNESAAAEDLGMGSFLMEDGMALALGYGCGFGTWDWPPEQVGCGEEELADGKCYGWPDLTISAPGQTLK